MTRCSPPRFALVVAAALATSLAATSCADTPVRTVEAYCAQLQLDLGVLSSPVIASPVDITATIERYRAVALVAPAAIEPEWQVLIGALDTAATVVPSDAESVASATDAALASTPAVVRIQQYSREMCGLELGTPPDPTYPVTVTTIAPATTTPG